MRNDVRSMYATMHVCCDCNWHIDCSHQPFLAVFFCAVAVAVCWLWIFRSAGNCHRHFKPHWLWIPDVGTLPIGAENRKQQKTTTKSILKWDENKNPNQTFILINMQCININSTGRKWWVSGSAQEPWLHRWGGKMHWFSDWKSISLDFLRRSFKAFQLFKSELSSNQLN